MNTLQPEQIFAQYRIVRRIGVGGMATVFQAVDTHTRRKVALKVLHEQWSYHDVARKRFELEASIGSNLKHPGIVPIFGYGVEAERPYIVMKYMSGDNLAREIKKSRSIQLSVTGKLLTLLASGLDYAHNKGVVHRDLKLENILLDDKRRPAISDFGIAKLIGSTRMTMTGQLIGTPQYMAPELLDITSDQIDKYVDLYAFAVMAYLMATGYFPFTSPESLALVYKHKRELAPIPTKVNPKLPRQLNPVLLRGLQKNPADRYPSAREFAEAFNKALVDKDGHTTLIFMNDINPVRGKIIADTAPASVDVTPYVGVSDMDMLEQPAHDELDNLQLALLDEEKTIPSAVVSGENDLVETYPAKHRKHRWLPIAAGLLLMTICGGSYIFTQDNLFSAAPVGSYTLPTATLLSSSLYSSQIEINTMEQAQMATMTAFHKGRLILAGTGTAEYTSNSSPEAAEIMQTAIEEAARNNRTQPTNTPFRANTAVPSPTDSSIVYPSNTPIPPSMDTAIPIPTDTPVPPTPEPVIPTDIPIAPTTVEIIPTVVEIIPTVVNLPPSNPTDEGGGNNGNGGGNGNSNDGGTVDLPILPPISVPGL